MRPDNVWASVKNGQIHVHSPPGPEALETTLSLKWDIFAKFGREFSVIVI